MPAASAAALARFLRSPDQPLGEGDDLRVRECMGAIRRCDRGAELDGRVGSGVFVSYI